VNSAFPEILHERDALAQQKAHLAEQIAQLRHNKPVASGPNEGAKGDASGERSKKEYKRQIEELQRRITGFESSQKEAAHELSKEREARIKIERNLTAAERARSEATALVEAIRVESRREIEAAAKKKEADFQRAEKELQEQIEALTQAQQKAGSERDELLAKIGELQRSVEQQQTALADAIAAQEKDAGWESRAVESLEGDIENYRTRIKALLKERDI
jgi:hypothetical protein